MPIVRFEEVIESRHYQNVADENWVAITDIRGSTAAIQAGRYKDVNTLGAATIVAVLNACGREKIPYVFGGDGSTLIIPPRHLEAVRQTLLGCVQAAHNGYGFELRCALIPVSDLKAAGAQLQIAFYQIATGVTLPAFRGGALALADSWAKSPEGMAKYGIKPQQGANVAEPDFTGLECRWRPIPAVRGVVASLIIQFLPTCTQESAREIIQGVAQAGAWTEGGSVFQRSQLQLATSPRELMSESRIHTASRPRFITWLKAFWLALLSRLIGRVLYWLRPPGGLGIPNWGRYFSSVLTQVDDRKFDDVFRAVIDATESNWGELQAKLESAKNQGKILYGAHISKEFLMTCMVLDRDQQHLHFVDGAQGGYALAARQLKSSIVRA